MRGQDARVRPFHSESVSARAGFSHPIRPAWLLIATTGARLWRARKYPPMLASSTVMDVTHRNVCLTSSRRSSSRSSDCMATITAFEPLAVNWTASARKGPSLLLTVSITRFDCWIFRTRVRIAVVEKIGSNTAACCDRFLGRGSDAAEIFPALDRARQKDGLEIETH